MATAANIYGWPERVWSDNAKAFKETLATALAALGVEAGQTRPYHPQGNGKAERFHQTVQKWLNARPPAVSITHLQTQLDEFRHVYNTQRPHRQIGRRFPADVWRDAPKSGPSATPLGIPTLVAVNNVNNGRCSIGIDHLVTIGAKYNGQQALTVTTGDTCHVFIDGHLVRQLTIDRTRRTQPLYKQSGQPPTINKPNREE